MQNIKQAFRKNLKNKEVCSINNTKIKKELNFVIKYEPLFESICENSSISGLLNTSKGKRSIFNRCEHY